jgi:CIC family chloride channel protein
MGAGYSVIDQALHGQFSWKLLLVLAALKIFATGISFLSGTPGGMFAPTLFIGAMLGGAVGSFEHHFFPSLTGTVGTYALVGMGVFFAGFLRTPITSVFMVIELTGSYTAILPIMTANLVAYFISRTYQKVPLFDLLARQDGFVLPSIEQQREQVPLTVEVAMKTDSSVVALPDELAADLARRTEEQKDALILVRMNPGQWLLLDRDELRRLAADGAMTTKAAEAKPRGPLPILFRDQSLEDALHAVGDWPAVPVVSRADLSKLEGIVTLADILRAFRNASLE